MRMGAETRPANVLVQSWLQGILFPPSETLLQSGSAITYCTLIIHKIKHKHE